MKLWGQQSESNSKPHFIMSHSFQTFGVLCQVGGYFFCVPICARIHEGIVTSNRDGRTLIDKANEMLASVCRGQEFVLLADAYYANGKVTPAFHKMASQAILVSGKFSDRFLFAWRVCLTA